MSIHEDFDEVDIVDLDYISDSPSFPSTGNSALSDSPPNDGLQGSVPTMLSDNDGAQHFCFFFYCLLTISP